MALAFQNCSPKITLQEGEYFLSKLEFNGNKAIYEEELDDVIPLNEKPNTRPFGLPITPRVWFYNFGEQQFNQKKHQEKLQFLQSKLESLPQEYSEDLSIEREKNKLRKKLSKTQETLLAGNGWLWRNIGERPTLISAEKANTTSQKIAKYLRDIGFKDAQVTYSLDSTKQKDKVILSYLIEEGSPYVIDTVVYYTKNKEIDSLIQSSIRKQRIKPGNRFDVRLVEDEKLRIEQLLKDNGYYNFIPQYIQIGAENASGDAAEFYRAKRGNLFFEILPPQEGQEHQRYKISEITLKAFDPFDTNENLSSDTTNINGVKFITLDPSLPLSILSRRIFNSNNNYYKLADIQETQRQLQYLNQFSFVSSQVTAINSEEVSLEYFAPLIEKYTLGTGPGLNHLYNQGQGFIGAGIPLTLTSRNTFKRLDLLDISLRAFWEGQPSPIDATSIRGSLELGSNITSTFPSIPFLDRKLAALNPQTQLGVGINYSEPFWGNRLNFRLNTSFSWKPREFTTILFSLLDANLINTNYNLSDPESGGSRFYQSLLEQQARGNNLKVTFDPQFVSSFNFTWLYNDQNPQQPYGSSQYFRMFLESGGTLMNLGQNKDRIGFIESFFPLRQDFNSPDSIRAYFRFVKVNFDYRRYVSLSPISSFAYRFNVGITNPYGGNKSLPFDKNFFAGGSNSVRAWSPRALGTGSAFPDTAAGNVIPQPGDIILEGSIEWRKKIARFVGDVQLACFIDYGNIWKWHQIDIPEKRDKANFDFSRFYKEFAVGTGMGLRLDLSYFLIRIDAGIKVTDPSRPEGQRFVLDEFSFRRRQPYGIQLNFGIGYPF